MLHDTHAAHKITKVVHLQCEAKDMGILVVSFDVFLIGLPENMPLQFLQVRAVSLAVFCLPQVPLFGKLKL